MVDYSSVVFAAMELNFLSRCSTTKGEVVQLGWWKYRGFGAMGGERRRRIDEVYRSEERKIQTFRKLQQEHV